MRAKINKMCLRVLILIITTIIIILTNKVDTIYALNIEEALKMAKENYPVIQSRIKQKEQAKYLYKSNYDPYYPVLSVGYSYRNAFDTTLHNITYDKIWDEQYGAYVSLSYRLFDGGYRRSKVKEAYHAYKQTENDVDITENDLEYMLKQAFFRAMASVRIYKVQKSTEAVAKRNLELAKARKQEGVAMLSDVTQAQVRYTQAKMDTTSARKDMEKAFAELNSLIGKPLNEIYNLEEEFKTDFITYKMSELQDIALEKRALIDKQLNELEYTKYTIKEQKSNFWPKVDLQLAYNRYDNKAEMEEHEAIFYAGLTYNIFDGPGRYYKVTAQKEALYASQKNLMEAKRTIRLEVNNAYRDIERSYANYNTAIHLVREGKINYEQALNEYRVGKGDIIALLQAEINYARSRITLIQQKMNYSIAISSLERAVNMKIL